MRPHFPAAALAVLLLAWACAPAEAQAHWRSLKSDAFLLFYPKEREAQARQALAELERCRQYAEALVGGNPLSRRRAGRRLSVVLVDAGTQSNGFADPAYRRLHLYLYPPSDPELGFAPSWWRLVGVHEYVHWLQLTSASGLPGALAWAFGDAWAPGVFNPSWLVEGLAVYAESAQGPYQGRLNAGFYDAYLETLLRAGRPPALPRALFAPPAFPGGEAPYLFGGQFVEYLARTYGQEAVTAFLREAAGSPLSYLTPLLPLAGVDRSARRAFGRRTAALWRDWLREAAAAAGEPGPAGAAAGRSAGAWWMDAPVPANGRVYYLRSLPSPAGPFRQSWRHELRELGPGAERTLARFPDAFSAGLKWREGRLYFGLRELERGLANVELGGFGAGTVLYALDPASGRRRRVLRAPLRAYEVLPGGEVVFSRDRPDAFGSEILLWSPAAGKAGPRLLASSEYLVREILVRGDRLFVSARRHGENFGIYQVDPRSFRLTPILPGPFSAGGLDFSEGRLRFAANTGGRYAIYAWDEEGSAAVRLTSAPYAASPALDPATGLLWYVGLQPEGYALFSLRPGAVPEPAAETAAEPEAEPAPAASAVQRAAELAAPAAAGFRAGGYGPNLTTLAPRLLLPVLAVGGPEGALAGATVLGRAALGDLAWSLTGLVDLATGEPAAEAAVELLTPPVAWNLAGSTRQPGWLGASAQVPLFRRLAPVSRRLDLGLAGYLYDGAGFPGRALEPFLDFGLDFALDALQARAALWLERVEWGAAENRALLEGELDVEHSFRFGALRAAFAGFQSLDGREGALAPLRGNDWRPAGEAGVKGNLDFFLRLLQIRSGAWNPPVYLQDLYLVPFAGAALTDRGQSQLTAGLELHWELKGLAVWTGLPLDLAAGLAVNAQGAASLYLGLTSPLQGLPLAGLKAGRMP